jgi:glycosyltransferase involved in cell wall biosynthesis
MRVAYFSGSNIPSETANSVHVMRMCEALANNGNDVTLYAMKGPKVDDAYKYYGVKSNFDILLWGKPWLKGRLYLYCLLTALRIKGSKPDVVLSRSLLGCYLLTLLKVEFIFENHNPRETLKGYQKRWFDKVVGALYMRKMIVISGALKSIILQETGTAGSRILVCHDAAKIPQVVESTISFKGDPGGVHVGYVGTIGKGRGIEIVLNCAKELREVGFHIIGGRKEDAASFLGDAAIPENVHFYGFVSPEQTEFYRSRCDALLAPYQRNLALRSNKNTSGYMSPLKIFEYMASCKPIIASDLPVLREVLNSDNAVLCSPDDHEDWIRAIRSLKSNPSKYSSIAAKAHQDFLNSYTWDRRAETILASA